MPDSTPFDSLSGDYDAWFDTHESLYRLELEAIRRMIPSPSGNGLEVGVGTGRFAEPLGIRTGLEPSGAMAALAEQRGITVAKGCAEALPFPEDTFDFVLMVTVICFLNDPEQALAEAYRVIKPGGSLIIGYVDRDTPLGQSYLSQKEESPYYRNADFYSSEEIRELMKRAGFSAIGFVQTLFPEDSGKTDLVTEGFGRGGFAVARGIR